MALNRGRHCDEARTDVAGRLVGSIVRRALEYWCNAENDLGERVERAFAPESP
jgi:hypothetical protein